MDWERKVKKLERILLRRPNSTFFLPLAEAYRETKRYEAAAALLQRGLRKHPEYTRARVGLGQMLLLLGQLDAARRELHQVVSLEPENLLARRLLGELYFRQGRFHAAALEFREFLRHAPTVTSIQSALREVEQAMAGA